MLRLIACGSLAAEAAHLGTFAHSYGSEPSSWLLTGLVAVLPAAYALLRGVFSVVLKEPAIGYRFDPVYVCNSQGTSA